MMSPSRSTRPTYCRSRLYDHATKVLGERGLVEIIGLCGYYTLVSMTLNAYEFDLPDGEISDLAE